MKPHLPLPLLLALASFSPLTQAADVVKNDLVDSLSNASSWASGAVPGASDVAVWEATSASGTVIAPLSLGGDTTWSGIRLSSDTPLNVSIGSADSNLDTLRLGADGLLFKSSSAAHQLNIYSNVDLTTAQSWGNSDGTKWRNGPTVNVHGNLTGSGNLTFLDASGISVSFHGDVSGYTGAITLNQWNNLSFARGMTEGNITANTYGGQSTILVKDGADTVYSHNLTLYNDNVSGETGPNRFTLAEGTLTLAGTTSITNDIVSIGAGATLNISGATTASGGTFTLNEGASLNIAGTTGLSDSVFSVGAGATLNISGATTASGATFTLGDGASLQFSAGSATKTSFSNATTFSGGGTVTVIGTHDVASANGTITIGSDTTLDLTQGRLVFTAYTNSSGAFIIQGRLKLSTFYYDGSIGRLADYSRTRHLDGGSILIEGDTHNSGQSFTVTDRGGSFLMTQSGETLTLSGNGNDNTIVFDNSNGNGELQLGGNGNIIVGATTRHAISGQGTIVKVGEGSVTLNNASSFSGSLIVQEGTLAIAHNEALGTGSTSIVYEGGILDLGDHALANVSISFKNEMTETDVVNGDSFLGSVNTGDTGTYDLPESMTFGSGYTVEADTSFTLTGDLSLGQMADGVRNFINGAAYAVTLTGEGYNLAIDNFDAVNSLVYGEVVTFENIGNITLQNNASASSEYTRGGAISANGAVSFLNTGAITMQNNAAGEANSAITGYGGALMADGGITFEETGDLNFSNNSAARNGGAIYNGSMGGDGIHFTDVGNVTFTGNTAGTADDMSDGGAIYEGGASVTVDRALSLTLTNNTAQGGAGGAIYAWDSIEINDTTGDVVISGNTATQSGGGLYTDSGSVTLSATGGDTTFQNNEAGSRGGAISAYDSVYLTDMTGTLTFSGNKTMGTSEGSDSGNGGAIYATYDVTISGIEGGVSFTNNSANMYGGAISATNVTLAADKGDIVFDGNTHLNGKALNAIDSQYGGTWTFDATEGREISFYDPVTGNSETAITVSLNGNADSQGTIRFSGEKVGSNTSATLDADASRYSDIYADTTLSGGTLIIENGATYGHVSSDWRTEETATSFTSNGGTVSLDKTSTLSAQTIEMSQTTLDAARGGILAAESVSFEEGKVLLGDVLTVEATNGLTFGSGVTLEATSSDAALTGTFTMNEGMAFTLSQENFQTIALTEATLTINGQLVLNDSQIDYTLDFWQTEQDFTLLTADVFTTLDGDFTGIVSATTGSSVIFERTPTLPTGQWSYSWDTDSTQLVAHWTPGIPEPGSTTLLLTALGFSLMRRRRCASGKA